MTASKVFFIGQDEIPRSIELTAGQSCELTFVALPGVSADLSLRVAMNGEGAQAQIGGLYICSSDERLNINVDVEHNVPGCVSGQLFKGIVGGRAQASFYGRIVVAQDAQRTEAFQANHNILLSDEARVNAKPQLEIYADDVKCSHGATVGKLNEDEVFYMRSRGIPETEARYLQMISFLHPVLNGISDAVLRESLEERVSAALRALK